MSRLTTCERSSRIEPFKTAKYDAKSAGLLSFFTSMELILAYGTFWTWKFEADTTCDISRNLRAICDEAGIFVLRVIDIAELYWKQVLKDDGSCGLASSCERSIAQLSSYQ